jgi:hypothetical protein
MLSEVELYTRVEGFENRLGHVYIEFNARFKDRPELAKFWSESALEEMQHGSMLRFCREHKSMNGSDIDPAACERIENLLETVSSVAKKPDLTVKEAFYASLLMEASELDELFSKLTRGMLPDHLFLYEAVKASLRSHHDRFAEAADRFLGDPAFAAAFRNLSRKQTAR